MRKNFLVRDFLQKNRVLIAYVRDVYGFRKGAVVAFMVGSNTDHELAEGEVPTKGELRMGWSLVNKVEDIEWKELRPDQLPLIQKIDNLVENYDGQGIEDSPIFQALEKKAEKAYNKLVRNHLQVRVPKFDVNQALFYALDRALDDKEENRVEVVADVILGDVPFDRDVQEAILATYGRAQRYFKLNVAEAAPTA